MQLFEPTAFDGVVMKIFVDLSETRSGLVALIKGAWASVEVCRLPAGDVSIGGRVLFERKTAPDFHASLRDGRLFRQAARLARESERPVMVFEGVKAGFMRGMREGGFRGVLLTLTLAFRIPVLWTGDVEETAVMVRHAAAQETKRENERLRREERYRKRAGRGIAAKPPSFPAETLRIFETLPGVGKHRARLLAERVGTVSDLAAIRVQDLLRVPGIGPDTAAKIADALQGKTCVGNRTRKLARKRGGVRAASGGEEGKDRGREDRS
jgi:ERCC4-type nuclease